MKRLAFSGTVLAVALVLTPLTSSTAAKPAPAPTAVDEYAGLGDSYSAGNGAFSTNLDRTCNRNTYAYPYVVSQARANTHLTFVACGGAVTGDIVSKQASSLSADTDYVSLTIGGNDVGFANLILNCGGWSDAACQSAVDTTNVKIADELPAKLDAAYAAIKAGAPNARAVVVLGYPHLLSSNISCAAATGISAAEVSMLNGVVDNLDATIGNRAAAAGFTFQSAISAFSGHDMCASDPWANGTSWSLADAYHPTRNGYSKGYAPLVRQVIG
jgi:hypothetical protein